MIVKIKDNFVTYTGDVEVERNAREELDKGKVVIVSERARRYEMYDRVDITTPYGTEQYLVQGDSAIRQNALEWEHQLELFENLARFRAIYPADRSFKRIGQTLGEILTVYQRELSTYHNISITFTTIPQSVLDEVIPFKEFDNNVNFAQILASLFRKIWAIPKVNRIGNDWDIYPFYFNLKNSLIDSNAVSESFQQNDIDYATKVKTQMKNVVNEKDESEIVWFPSPTGYILPRSSSLEQIESRLRYELDSRIIAIIQVVAVGLSFTAFDADGTSPTFQQDVPFTDYDADITTQVVQEDVWDTLKTPDKSLIVSNSDIAQTNNKKNNIRFRPNERYITNLFEAQTDKIFFTSDTPYLLHALRRAIYLELNETGIYDPPIFDSGFTTKDVKIRVKYIRQRDIDMTHHRKTKGFMNDATTTHSQRDASIEMTQYKRVMKNFSNRLGNKVNSKIKVFSYDETPYSLFDFTNEGTIVTRVKNIYKTGFISCEYEESENFANIEAEYALSRGTDPYTISTKSVTTNIISEEYIEFSETDKTNSTRLDTFAQRGALGLLESSTISGFNPIDLGVFKPLSTNWDSSNAIVMKVESDGGGNSMTFHVFFEHQLIAGKTYYDFDTQQIEDYLNPLIYTEEDGSLEDFKIYFTPSVEFQDQGEYPLILDETNYLSATHTNTNITEPLDLDFNASFAMTYQISFVADDNIIVGESFSEDNYLVKNQPTVHNIQFYKSTKPYSEYDTSNRSYDTVANITMVYDSSFKTITFTALEEVDYFSIIRNGRLLLAFNKHLDLNETYVVHINFLSSTTFSVQYNVSIDYPEATGEADTVNAIDSGDQFVLERPIIDNYDFNGWLDKDNNFTLIDSSVVLVLNDITRNWNIYADYTLKEYTVSFNMAGGSPQVPSQTVQHGSLATEPSNPTRDGYDFIGWDFDFLTPITSDITITAQWQIADYTLTADNQFEGTPIDYGTYPLAGISFTYDGNTTFNTVTATFNDSVSYSLPDEANGLQPISLFGVSLIDNPENKTGTIQVTGDLTVPIVWDYVDKDLFIASNVPTTITYSVDGGANQSSPIDSGYDLLVTTQHASSVVLTAPLQQGDYDFVRFYDDNGNTISTNNSITLAMIEDKYVNVEYALRQLTVTIDYSTETGLADDVETATIGTNYAKERPIVTGYSFVAWKDKDNNFVTIDTSVVLVLSAISRDWNIFAEYEVNQYTITFDTNGGDALSPQTYDYNEQLSLPIPTRTGFTFDGWFANPELTQPFNDLTMPAEDITLYAKWSGVEYNVSIDYPANTGVTDTTTSVLSGDQFVLERPVVTGFTFNGWYDKDNNFVIIDSSVVLVIDPVERNWNIFADYDINQYTVTFDSNGGTAVSSITQDYDTSVSEPTSPTKSGYTFAGWYYDSALTNPVTFPFNMPASNITLFAKWDVAIYNVSISTSNSEIQVSYDGTDASSHSDTVTAGGSISASAYAEWNSATLNGTWVFQHWLVNGNIFTTNTNITYNNITEDLTMVAVYNFVEVGWSVGGTSPSGLARCQWLEDVGNTICDTEQVCNWNSINSYLSSTDESTAEPDCSSGNQWTVCVETSPGSGQWLCDVRETDGTTTTEYSNCQTCEIIE